MATVFLGLLWGLIFGGVFSAATLAIGRINAEMLLSSYPPDIRARYGSMRSEVQRQARAAGLVLMAALLGVIAGGLLHLHARAGLEWGRTFLFLLIMLQTWNLIDLLILDWLVLMTLRPRFMILPGTEGMAGYRDYRYHWGKFLRGILLITLMAAVLTPLVMGAVYLLTSSGP